MVASSVQETTAMLLLFSLVFLALHPHSAASAYQYKVGDLDSWGVPPPGKPQLYSAWSQSHNFTLGDSLLFLYPPSQDSVVQVTEAAFTSCSLGDPILKLDDGNSVFNLTTPGVFYFTSGVPGHCQKHQRLRFAVPFANGTFFPPDAAGGPAGALSATAPAYPNVFGPSSPPSAAPPGLRSAARSGLLGLVLLFFCT